jgi:alanyl-tRNA synthetase
MSEAFPELKKNPQRVIKLIEEEEISFGRTLDRGIELFELAARDRKISAEDAFKLHDTYGFPIDLTRIMAEERGLSVDIAGYEKLMEQAKERARSGGREAESSAAQLPPDALADLQRRGIRPTDDSAKFFHSPIPAKVLAVWYGTSGHFGPEAIATDDDIAVILDRTNFYAEMGGQVGDAGELRTAAGAIFDVSTTRIVGGYVLHVGKLRGAALHVGDAVTAIVLGGRERTEKNHTATHLLNWALRQVIGGDVLQKGSLVDADKLRFDFSHGQAVADEEIAQTQALVNQAIARKIPVYTGVAPQEKALKINGLRAVFGEKYPAQVRILSVGVSVADLLADPANAKWRDHSIEFCGGTHLTNTAQIEAFAIVSEESVSKGVRRIVALTGQAAQESQALGDAVDQLAAHAGGAADASCPALLASLQKSLAAGNIPLNAKRRGQAAIGLLQGKLKALEKAQKAQAAGANSDVLAVAAKLLADAAPLGPGRLMVGEIPWSGDEQLRAAVDSLKKKAGSYAILLAANDGQKLSLAAAVSDDLIALGLKAGDWVRQAAQIAGGGGGGRPQMAQGSGKDPARLSDVLAAARDFAAKALQ